MERVAVLTMTWSYVRIAVIVYPPPYPYSKRADHITSLFLYKDEHFICQTFIKMHHL